MFFNHFSNRISQIWYYGTHREKKTIRNIFTEQKNTKYIYLCSESI